jgi:ABC-type multidrug transport system permease subunit
MSLTDHTINGIVSLLVSVGFTALTADEEPWDRNELLLSVAVSAFLSGFFTSYFAAKD